MLRSLRVRHFVLMDDVTLDLEGGLTLFTGETEKPRRKRGGGASRVAEEGETCAANGGEE